MFKNYKVHFNHCLTLVCWYFCEWGKKTIFFPFFLVMIIVGQHRWVFVSKLAIEVTWWRFIPSTFHEITEPPAGPSENVAHWVP